MNSRCNSDTGRETRDIEPLERNHFVLLITLIYAKSASPLLSASPYPWNLFPFPLFRLPSEVCYLMSGIKYLTTRFLLTFQHTSVILFYVFIRSLK